MCWKLYITPSRRVTHQCVIKDMNMFMPSCSSNDTVLQEILVILKIVKKCFLGTTCIVMCLFITTLYRAIRVHRLQISLPVLLGIVCIDVTPFCLELFQEVLHILIVCSGSQMMIHDWLKNIQRFFYSLQNKTPYPLTLLIRVIALVVNI